MIAASLAIVSLRIDDVISDEFKANGCTARPEALSIVLFESEGADCKGTDEKAISEEEDRP